METVLKEKLWAYIVHNNPDLLFSLQQTQSITSYLEDKVRGIGPLIDQLLSDRTPSYEIEEQCLSILTADLKPSKYMYVRSVLEEEFPSDYQRMEDAGILTYEILNMLQVCREIFDELQFSLENEDERYIRYAIIAQVHDYLN